MTNMPYVQEDCCIHQLPLDAQTYADQVTTLSSELQQAPEAMEKKFPTQTQGN
jgi:hypothetical protein